MVRRRRTSGLAVLALATYGLAAAAQQPPPPPPPAPPAPPAATAAGAVERLTFREAIDRALARNPTVREAAAEALRASALVQQARSTSLPHVTANASYTRLQRDVTFGGQVITPIGLTSGNATFSVPLVDLASWAQWAHALDDEKVARLSAADVRRKVAVATANAFLMGIARHRVLEADQRALSTARAHFDVAHQRQVGGIASRLEEVQAAQEASNDEVLVEQAGIDLRRAQEALGVLLAADAPVDPADEPAFAEIGDLDAAEGSALTGLEDRRTDVQTLAARQSAAERVLSDSWRDYLPTLDFALQDLFQSPSTLFQRAQTWQAQLLFSWSLYDGGLRGGRVGERRALVEEAKANLAGARDQARADVRDAVAAIRAADRGLASARNASREAHDALEISNLSYGAGASTSLDVLDSERRARDADTAVATAEDAARQARLDLLVASGRFP
ncbi:MAG TPA: TolC family protein [Thermoanaerobaculia bacterium]